MRHLALAVLLGGFGVGSAGAEPPVRLFVFSHEGERLSEAARKDRIKETEAAHDRAEEARKSLQKALESRHGKGESGWPADVRPQLEAARRAEYESLIAHHQIKTDPSDLDKAAQSLAKTIADLARKQPQVALADSREQADLSVEVLARRAKTSFPGAAWFVYLTVKPERMEGTGARFTGTSFGQVRRTEQFVPMLGFQSMAGSVVTLHPYSEPEPYWTIEVAHQGSGYFVAIQAAAEALMAFGSGLAGPSERKGASGH
jgi:hypothetical protein